MSDAAVYRCPSCGAPADPTASACAYCRAALHPVRCPWCFEWTDAGARDCARCGASAPAPDARALKCPSCRGHDLFTRVLGGASLAGCPGCGGVWTDAVSFKRLCEDRAAQAAYMGPGSALPPPIPSDPSAGGIFYRPCPVCGELMNRFNFASCSGVILDACKPHGVWFDPDELRKIVEFIRDGGLDVAREKERMALEFERRRLGRTDADPPMPLTGFTAPVPSSVAAARGLLDILLGRDF